jgi:hypothetical protein
MNERIKELAKQADEGYTGDSRDDMGASLVGNDAIEKFAELIVRECVAICQDTDGEELKIRAYQMLRNTVEHDPELMAVFQRLRDR